MTEGKKCNNSFIWWCSSCLKHDCFFAVRRTKVRNNKGFVSVTWDVYVLSQCQIVIIIFDFHFLPLSGLGLSSYTSLERCNTVTSFSAIFLPIIVISPALTRGYLFRPSIFQLLIQGWLFIIYINITTWPHGATLCKHQAAPSMAEKGSPCRKVKNAGSLMASRGLIQKWVNPHRLTC